MDLAIQQMDKIPTASYDYSYEYCHSRLLAPEAQLYFHVHRHLQALNAHLINKPAYKAGALAELHRRMRPSVLSMSTMECRE